MSSLKHNTQMLSDLILKAARPGVRQVIAIAGPPGSGKSTLAEAVVDRINAQNGPSLNASLLPMDGFHLDNEALEPLGLADRKGAHETFDAKGFLHLMQEVRAHERDLHYPVFDRTIDRAIPDAGLLSKSTDVVVVEGNYLLLNKPIWRDLAPLFDVSVFLQIPLPTLEQRLLQRWLTLGFSRAKAEQKVYGNDLKNAALVLRHSMEPDLTLSDLPKTKKSTVDNR